MEIKPVYEDAKITALQRIAVTQAVVEARLLPSPGISIAQVLSITARAEVGSTEAFTGEARFTGKVSFAVTFVDEDGHNRVISTASDFSDKIESPLLSATTLPQLCAAVLDVDAVSLSRSEIRLAAVVEIKLSAETATEVKYLRSGGEGVYTCDEKLTLSRPVARGKAGVTAEARLDKVSLVEVLSCENKAYITGARAERDCAVISGVIISFVCGETEDGLIGSYRVETPFEEEISAPESRGGDVVRASADVTAAIRTETDEDSRAIVIEYDVPLCFTVFAMDGFTAVTDVFSPTSELKSTVESVTLQTVREGKTVLEHVDGSVTLDVSMPVVDNVLAACGLSLSVTNAVAMDGEAVVEGIVGGSVIYYSAEVDKKSSVAVEIPFSLHLDYDCREGDELCADGEVIAAALKIRRGNEIDVRADVALRLDATASAEARLITAVSVGKEITAPCAGISVHIAKRGETLWSLARALCCTPELIAAQNPTLSFPLSGGERVILFRHLDRK